MTTDQTPPQVFKLTGQVDMARQAELDAIAAAAIQTRLAIVDVTEISFYRFDRYQIAVHTRNAIEEKGGRLRGGRANRSGTRLIASAGLEGVIEVFPTHLEAAES